jgi:hypothetical protein
VVHPFGLRFTYVTPVLTTKLCEYLVPHTASSCVC